MLMLMLTLMPDAAVHALIDVGLETSLLMRENIRHSTCGSLLAGEGQQMQAMTRDHVPRGRGGICGPACHAVCSRECTMFLDGCGFVFGQQIRTVVQSGQHRKHKQQQEY